MYTVLHVETYDAEPTTVVAIDTYVVKYGHEVNFASGWYRHEIYPLTKV